MEPDERHAESVVDLRRCEEDLQVCTAQQEAMIANISDVIAIVDPEGIIRYKSPNIEKWFGWRPGEVVGVSTWDNIHGDDRGRVKRIFADLVTVPGSTRTGQCRYRCSDGDYKWIEFTASNLIEDPCIKGVLLNYHDISGRKRAEEQLNEVNERYRIAIEQTGQIVYDLEVSTGLVKRQGAIEKATGFLPEEFGAIDAGEWLEGIHPDDRISALDRIESAKRNVGHFAFEYRYRRKDGSYLHICDRGVSLPDSEGKVGRILGTMTDITDLKLAEEDLELKKFAIDNARDAVYLISAEGRFLDANDAACRMTGFTQEQLLSSSVSDINPALSQGKWEEAWEELKRSGSILREHLHRNREGGVFAVEVAANYFKYKNIEYSCAFVRDITQRKEEEAALRDSRQALQESLRQLEGLLDNIPDIAWLKDSESRFIAVNQPFARACGLQPRDVVAKTDMDVWPRELAQQYRADDAEVMERQQRKQVVEQLVNAQGGTVWIETIKTPIFDVSGAVTGTAGIARDITTRKVAEEAHEKTLRQLQLILDAVGEGIYGLDTQGRVTFINPAAANITGWRQEEFLGVLQHSVLHHTKPDGSPYPAEECLVYKSFKDGTIIRVSDEVFWRKDGSSFPVEYVSTPIVEGSNIVGAVVVFKDVTEQRQAEKEKSDLELQLRQSQKMEAIGQLAGGIAHDFNNILTVIGAYGEMMLKRMDDGDPLRQHLAHILAAADRAATLTTSLLAFSRKQMMHLQFKDLNRIMYEMGSFLRRILGEDIHLDTRVRATSLPVRVDSGQIEQVLMNLAANARDAMPKGGSSQSRLNSRCWTRLSSGRTVMPRIPDRMRFLRLPTAASAWMRRLVRKCSIPSFRRRKWEKERASDSLSCMA